jgi:hypothetical protein
MAAGDGATVLARLSRYRDAEVTDLAVRVVPLGDDAKPANREAALRSSSRGSARGRYCPNNRP